MKPESFGRKLGIGVRVAARMVGERAADAAQASRAQAPELAQATLQRTAKVAEKTRAVTRASRRFGEAIWGPIVHLGGVLWLEITGLFFALFALFFAQSVYRLRHAYLAGPDHQRFLVYAALTLVFSYFTISSFYRARRKERRKKP
jgi:Flp pilus assembly protein TadB